MALRTDPKPIFLDFDGVIGTWVSDSVAPANYSDFLELESIEITVPEVETVKLIGRRTSTLGLAIDSQNRATDSVAACTIKTNTFHPALLAIAMGANVSETTQAGADVTLDTVTTVLNVWVPLTNYAIAPHDTGKEVVLKTSSDVTVAHNAQTLDAVTNIQTFLSTGTAKFQLDLDLGMIRAVHTDAVGAGMKLAYDKEARTWETYEAGAALSSYVHIMGKAKNSNSGKVGTLDIWRANLAPDGPFTVPTGEKHFQGSFKGDLITPTVSIRGAVPTRPWRFRDRTA